MQQSEEKRVKRAHAKGEFIHRKSDERLYLLSEPRPYKRAPYPWEMNYVGKHPKITKEYFRCKGSSLNPPHADHKDPARAANYIDCGGFQKHSLPIRAGQEFVYPVLLNLLNYIQEKTGHKVIVTCGHRCPVHNSYADPSPQNQSSKHMVGGEVDFYVQGMEDRADEIVALVMQYYKGQAKEYEVFERLVTGNWNVSTPPWGNREIVIKLYQKNEGRDFDNRHPYPYLGVQVRIDRETGEKVIADWQKAFKGYQRF